MLHIPTNTYIIEMADGEFFVDYKRHADRPERAYHFRSHLEAKNNLKSMYQFFGQTGTIVEVTWQHNEIIRMKDK